jgi:thymidylate synthase (FAD)
MEVRLVSQTFPLIGGPKTGEELVVYIARVSNPSNQNNMETAPKLIRYLLNNKHFSPFEMVDMTVEIKTSRAIAAQILRHRSFSFQEFSQRYSSPTDFERIELRWQAKKNRQSSEEVFDDRKLLAHIDNALSTCTDTYEKLIANGVSKETARMILPLTTQTTLYMKGSLRSWITYFMVRIDKHTQKEHREIALAIKKVFVEQYPTISEALEWKL